MNIRTMVIEDYASAYALWLQTPGMGLNHHDDSEAGIARYLSKNPNSSFVAEEDGVIIGVILSGHDGRRGFIYHAAVAEDQQRRGLGTALLDAALSALAQEGIGKVALVAYNTNGKGNAFWEKQGFAVRDDVYYRDKAMVELVRIDT